MFIASLVALSASAFFVFISAQYSDTVGRLFYVVLSLGMLFAGCAGVAHTVRWWAPRCRFNDRGARSSK